MRNTNYLRTQRVTNGVQIGYPPEGSASIGPSANSATCCQGLAGAGKGTRGFERLGGDSKRLWGALGRLRGASGKLCGASGRLWEGLESLGEAFGCFGEALGRLWEAW